MSAQHNPPYGAPGLSEDERLRAFARRCLELVALSEKARAQAQARGEDSPLHWGDYFTFAASRWGLRP